LSVAESVIAGRANSKASDLSGCYARLIHIPDAKNGESAPFCFCEQISQIVFAKGFQDNFWPALLHTKMKHKIEDVRSGQIAILNRHPMILLSDFYHLSDQVRSITG
jgi:hypothetical protein